jgi:uncharacterized damage-inducible protein DinB
MEAHVEAGLTVLEELYDHLTEAIRPLDSTTLNWKPGITESNSIAALVRHTIASTDAWFSRAMNEPVTRDRDEEFRFQAGAQELVDQVVAARGRLRDQFTRLESVDPAEIRRYMRLGRQEESSLSVAWCVEHAIVHAAEHWGQIQLTIQLAKASSH